MVNKIKKILLILTVLFTCFIMTSCKDEVTDDGMCEVVFLNYDGSLLYKTKVEKGSQAIYQGPEIVRMSTKEGTKIHRYLFVGWDKDLSVITEDIVTRAKFIDSYQDIENPDDNSYAFSYKLMMSVIGEKGYGGSSFMPTTISYEEDDNHSEYCNLSPNRNDFNIIYNYFDRTDGNKNTYILKINVQDTNKNLTYKFTYTYYGGSSFDLSSPTAPSDLAIDSVTGSGIIDAQEFNSETKIEFIEYNSFGEELNKDFHINMCSELADKAFKEFAKYFDFIDMRTLGLDNYYLELPSDAGLADYKYERCEDGIYFGYYPFRKVTGVKICAVLNSKAGNPPSVDYYNDWTPYGYFSGSGGYEYMWYKDIEYAGSKYRGVYFVSYRPSWNGASSKSYQTTNKYVMNTIYWFEYQKIKWQILEEDNGKLLLVSDWILDSQEFYDNKSEDLFEHNGKVGYANNYELSNIRRWLNETFYETAFSDLQKSIILDTNIDNSVTSTGYEESKYVCDNLTDKMFLLSVEEVNRYYVDTKNRMVSGSDYAKCQGLGQNNNGWGYYYTRSPFYKNDNFVSIINGDGTIGYDYVDSTYRGIRPSCVIDINE